MKIKAIKINNKILTFIYLNKYKIVIRQDIKPNFFALLPIGIFLTLYLGLGVLFEYVLKIPMGFYKIPIIVVFLIALFFACLQNRKINFNEKLQIMARGIGNFNIVSMILIFLLAGIFAGIVGRTSATSVAYCLLSTFPSQFAVIILFIVSCFVSISMGTSLGTVALITPIAYSVAENSGFPVALCVASVICGSFFGDNLSVISDTTIAVCNGQGCKMKDKFYANLKIVSVAVLITLTTLWFISSRYNVFNQIEHDWTLINITPYLIVLALSIIGLNVFIVLTIGIVIGAIISVFTGVVPVIDLLEQAGKGANGMFETIIVVLLVSSISALIEKNGGFVALLNFIQRIFKGKRMGQFGIAFLVSLTDIATANNTVAIVVANPIAKQIATKYRISAKRTASIIDTFACMTQGIIPYGAQMLVAISAVATLGGTISAFDIISNLYYIYALFFVSIIYILRSK